jgi:acyl-coenzyme A thioesterase 9
MTPISPQYRRHQLNIDILLFSLTEYYFSALLMIPRIQKSFRFFSSTVFNLSETHNENVTNFIRLAEQKFNNPKYDAKKQRPRDSFVQEFLYFKSNPEIYLAYSDWTKKSVRIGKILEDLDILAGMIGFNHAVTPKNKDTIQLVTASLDRIEMIRDIPSNSDIRMSGQVNFVGRSSMEITIIVDTVPDGFKADGQNNGYDASFVETKGDLILSAEFTMVALDKNTMKSIELEQLRVETNQDKDLFEKGARRKAAKLVSQRFSLKNAPPTVEEMYAVHEVHLEAQKRTEKLPNNLIWMHDTEQNSISLTHYSERNINNKIFGGYLMRLAFEQAYATALLTTKNNVRFISLEGSSRLIRYNI